MASDSIAHSALASLAIDSQPIRGQGIIVKYIHELPVIINFHLLVCQLQV